MPCFDSRRVLFQAALILKESMEAEAAQQDLHNAQKYLAALQAEGATPREIEGDSHTHFLLCRSFSAELFPNRFAPMG